MSRASVFKPVYILVAPGVNMNHRVLKPDDHNSSKYLLNIVVNSRKIPVYFYCTANLAEYSEMITDDRINAVLHGEKDMFVFGKPNVVVDGKTPEIYLRNCALDVLCTRGYHCSYTDIDISSTSELDDFLAAMRNMVNRS